MFHVSAYQFSLHLRRLRRWDRGWPARIDRFLRSTCACLENFDKISDFENFDKIREERKKKSHWRRKLFPLRLFFFYLFTIIFIREKSRWESGRIEIIKLKWKGYSHGSGGKEKRSCLVSSRFLKEKEKGGRKKCLERLFGFSHVPR